MSEKNSINAQGICEKLRRRMPATHKQFGCNQCQKSFSSKISLYRHELRHTSVKSHVCYYCGKSFWKNYKLTRHLQTIHTSKKPFKCDRCDKSFLKKYKLTIHERTHIGVKPSKWGQCGKFVNETLQTQLTYNCSFCGMFFSQTSDVECHKLTHTSCAESKLTKDQFTQTDFDETEWEPSTKDQCTQTEFNETEVNPSTKSQFTQTEFDWEE